VLAAEQDGAEGKAGDGGAGAHAELARHDSRAGVGDSRRAEHGEGCCVAENDHIGRRCAHGGRDREHADDERGRGQALESLHVVGLFLGAIGWLD
jgi:hypothetical protein